MGSGIYAILHLSSGRHYIGSAADLTERWLRHQGDLRRNRHHNPKLQNAWNKYGLDDFRFDVLEVVDEGNLVEREQFWIDATLPFYNILRVAGSAKGYKHTDEAKSKMSYSAKAWWEKIPKNDRAELLASRGFSMSGATLSEETKAKISEACKGRTLQPQQLANLELRLSPDAVAKRALKRSKTYVVTNPDGVEQTIIGLAKFCRENGLSQGNMSAVAKGERESHKGWVCREVAAT